MLDDLCGGWIYESFVPLLLEHFPVRGYLTEQGLVRLLLSYKVIGKRRPLQLSETLWVVEDKERFRALSAAVTFGEDLTDLLMEGGGTHGDHAVDGADGAGRGPR